MRGDYLKLVKEAIEKTLMEGMAPGFSSADIMPADAIMVDNNGKTISKIGGKLVDEALDDAKTQDISPEELEKIKAEPEDDASTIQHADRPSKLLSRNLFIDEETGKNYSDEDMMALISRRPKILGQNTKMQHSGGELYEFYNTSLPAYKGLYVDEKNKKFKVVITCPGAGKCTKICYAMSGRFKFKGPSLRAAQLITYIMNDYEGYADQLIAEIGASYYQAKSNRKGLVIRWHDAGDIISPKYLQIMFDIASKTPNIIHYAYTKNVPLVKEMMDKKPKNFEITYSLDGLFDEFINHEIDRKAIIIPDDMFFDLKGGRDEEVKFDENAINIMKQRISEKFKVPENSIITYPELMKTTVNMDKKLNVLVYSENDGDDAAIRPDVNNIFLFYHGKTLIRTPDEKKQRAKVLKAKKIKK